MGAVREVKVPDIGDFEAVDVIEVLISPGDPVERDQGLITLESDKATMEVPSTEAGMVQEVKVAPGDKVSEGHVVCTVEVADAGGEAAGDAAETSAQDAAVSGSAVPEPDAAEGAVSELVEEPTPAEVTAPRELPAQSRDGQGIDRDAHRAAHASPAVRRFARELGVDVSRVTGTGPKGRIRREDVQAYVKSVLQGPGAASGAPAAGAGIPPIPEVDFSQYGEVERVPLSRIQKLSGPHLHRSWLNVPHVTQFEEADVTELEAFRRSLREEAEARGVRLTPLAFMVRACVAALRKHPRFNASLAPNGEELILKHYIHIGVAVDTPQGLVVPVIRDADQLGVLEIAERLGELSAKARDGKLSPREMQGGSFSISSLGGIGGTAFTPIVNAPEVAILGVSKSQVRPVWDGAQFQPRTMLPLSLSYDHRVIDGAMAARFTTDLSAVLSDIRRLVL